MHYLILDTSTDNHFLALFSPDGRFLLKEGIEKNSTAHSLALLLCEIGLSIQELKGIFVGIGPGSYTGTRTGVITAKSLALALTIPLYPFYSPLAFLPKNLPSEPFCLVYEGKTTHFRICGQLDKGQISTSPVASFETDTSGLIPGTIPNIPPLIPYLSSLTQKPPERVEIVYFQNL